MDLFRQYMKKSPANGESPQPQTSLSSSSRQVPPIATSSIGRKMSGDYLSNVIINGGGILLRVVGLGQQFDFDVSPTTTLGNLKNEIERKTSIPPSYQRLVAKRKKMDDDSMVLGTTAAVATNNGIATTSPTGIGLENRTKILLFHSPLYEKDKEGIEKLIILSKEIDRIDTDRQNYIIDNNTVQELIIQVCCKLDCVETHGSEALRKMRKSTILKAEDVARKSEMKERRG